MKTKTRKFKWSERQKRALRGSIRKWEGIVDGSVEDQGSDNCTCCKMYLKISDNLEEDDECGKCPIFLYTGKPGCLDTPYMDYFGEKKEAKKELLFIKKVYKAGA